MSLEDMQLNLANLDSGNEDFAYNLNFPKKINFIDNLIPNNFYLFQFKKNFFEKINWNEDKLDKFFKLLLSKVENVLFISDIFLHF